MEQGAAVCLLQTNGDIVSNGPGKAGMQSGTHRDEPEPDQESDHRRAMRPLHHHTILPIAHDVGVLAGPASDAPCRLR